MVASPRSVLPFLLLLLTLAPLACDSGPSVEESLSFSRSCRNTHEDLASDAATRNVYQNSAWQVYRRRVSQQPL